MSLRSIENLKKNYNFQMRISQLKKTEYSIQYLRVSIILRCSTYATFPFRLSFIDNNINNI